MTDRYDAIRAANPELQINIYGMTPYGPVTLEVIDVDGFAAQWTAPTAELAMLEAFPPEQPEPADAPAPDQPTPSIFD